MSRLKKDHIAQLRKMVENSPIEWMRMAGIRPEIIEQGHVRFVLAVKGLHLNHVNTVYAGSMFAFAEMSGGAVFQATYGFDEWVPIVKKASIRYIKPAQDDLICELRISDEEARQRIAPIAEKGRGDFILTIPLLDLEGGEVAEAEINYYILPVPR